jgi:hypothetical protein
MAEKRSTGRQGGRKAAPTPRPADQKVVKLTIRMTAALRWRLRSYAADQQRDIDDLVIALIEADMAGWYTARRGDAPAAGRPDGGPLGVVPPADDEAA